jgi:hypothetical protein
MQMIAGENLLPEKSDTRSDAAIARVVAANPDASFSRAPHTLASASSSSSSSSSAAPSPLSLQAIVKAQQKMSVEKKEQEAMLRLIESK